jgi:DNA-binding FadR family transcriptional regulator
MTFHRHIVVAARNVILIELFGGFVPRLPAAMIKMLRIRPIADEDADQRAHRDLADAIADHDAAKAARLSRQHLEGLKTRLG